MLMFFMNDFHAIGVMSGTSLDGVDIAYCSFKNSSNWSFKILKAESFKYNENWTQKLKTANELSGINLLKLHNSYGQYLGKMINSFIIKNNIDKIDCIASHGHTVFHQPREKITFQLGCGAAIASSTKKTVVSDFRTLDVQLSGQGAPLVPFGDRWLFENYDYCLNLGGIANISFQNEKIRLGKDVTFANMASNYLASRLNKTFDNNGEIAASGSIDHKLLTELKKPTFFKLQTPKSLSREDFEQWFKPIFDSSTATVPDKLATLSKHIGECLKAIVPNGSNVLVTGGGAHNNHWMATFRKDFSIDCILPKNEVIDFKEALIFAFLGIIRLENKTNTYASVTGATSNSTGGVVHYG